MQTNQASYQPEASLLLEMKNSSFEMRRHAPDLRGWPVVDNRGARIGQVVEFLVEPATQALRYLVVDLRGNTLNLPHRLVPVPIGTAELPEKENQVMLPRATPLKINNLPDYGSGPFTRNQEVLVRQAFTGGSPATPETTSQSGPDPNFYQHDFFRVENLFRNRSFSGGAGIWGLIRPRNSQAAGQEEMVIHLFGTAPEAERARQILAQKGYPAENIRLVIRKKEATRVYPKEAVDDAGFFRFYKALFSSAEEAKKNQAWANDSEALIAVLAGSVAEAHQVGRILDSIHEVTQPGKPFSGMGEGWPLQAVPTGSFPVGPSQSQPEQSGSGAGSGRLGKERQPAAPGRHKPFVSEEASVRHQQVWEEKTHGKELVFFGQIRSFESGTIEIVEHAEVPILTKVNRVVEEIRISNDGAERKQIMPFPEIAPKLPG